MSLAKPGTGRSAWFMAGALVDPESMLSVIVVEFVTAQLPDSEAEVKYQEPGMLAVSRARRGVPTNIPFLITVSESLN